MPRTRVALPPGVYTVENSDGNLLTNPDHDGAQLFVQASDNPSDTQKVCWLNYNWLSLIIPFACSG